MLIIGSFSSDNGPLTVVRRWSMAFDYDSIENFICRESGLSISGLREIILIEDEAVIDRYNPSRRKHPETEKFIDDMRDLVDRTLESIT